MPDLQGMSIDIEGLMAEVEKFKNRLAQLEDELTPKGAGIASDVNTPEATPLRAARKREKVQVQATAREVASPASETEDELAALVRSAFAHKTRASRRG